MTEETFWNLTLKQFDALCKQKKLIDRRIESYSAQISCLLYNIHRGNNPHKSLEEFMTKETIVKHEQTPEEMKNIAKIITQAFGGEIK